MIQFRLLGPLELEVDGQVADIGGPRQRAILALLLLHRNHPVSRAELVDRVWGPDAPATATHAVEVYVSKLRRFTDPGVARGAHQVLCNVPGGYVLRAPDGMVDAARFENLVRAGDAAARAGDTSGAAGLACEAEALWRGPAMAGLREFEFAAIEAERLDELRAGAAEHQARALVRAGDAGAAVHQVAGWVAEHPLREGLVEQLMLAKRDAGDLSGALATYHRARRALISELGVEPSDTLRALAAEISNTGVSSGTGAPVRFGQPSTSVIGREEEVAQISELARRNTLVTITGFPGIGKSTVAAEVCRRLAAGFKDGAYAVDLERVREYREIFDQVARALGLQDQAVRRTREVLRSYLAERELLLVFDNADHLAGSLKEGFGERQTAPGVHSLVTAVVPLGALDEAVFNLGPLSLPSSTHVDDMRASGAVALLRDRLLMVNSERTFRGQDEEAIYRICHRLDGLPMAIEVAAARASVSSLPELAESLDQDLSAFTAHPGAGDSARRALGSALDAAYSGLPAPERRVLLAAAVFRGSIDPDMLLRVAGLGGLSRERQAAMVQHLVGRALLSPSRVGMDQPLRMLAATRAFVLGKMPATRIAQCRQRYVECFASECERLAAQLERSGQVRALDWLERELDNIRACLRALLEGGDAERALAIAANLSRFWWVRGHLTEGRRWLREGLAGSPAASSARAEALRTLAYLEWSQGEFTAAQQHCIEALDTSEEIGDAVSLTRSFYYLGVAEHATGRLDAARAAFRKGLALVRALPDPPLEGLILDMLGRAMISSGQLSQGRGASERSLVLLKAGGDAFGIAACLTNLAEARGRDGEVEPARVAYAEALERFRALRCVVGEGYALQGLAWVAGANGDLAEVARLVDQVRQCWERTGYVPTQEDEQRNAEILAARGA